MRTLIKPLPLRERIPQWLVRGSQSEDQKGVEKKPWPRELWLTYRDKVVVIKVIDDEVRIIPGHICCHPRTPNPDKPDEVAAASTETGTIGPDNILSTLVWPYAPVAENVLEKDVRDAPILLDLDDPHLLKREELGYFTQPEFVYHWFGGTYQSRICDQISKGIIKTLL